MKKKELTYKLLFEPEFETNYEEYNYLYKDNYIHTRLNVFGDRQIKIKGFENKLSFLITFLINNICERELFSKELIVKSNDLKNLDDIWNECLNCFYKSKEYAYLEKRFSKAFKNFKGITILPMYSKKIKYKNCFDALGECKCFNINSNYTLNELNLATNLLEDFENYFNINDAVDFIYDNSYEIVIEPKAFIDNAKFIKKHSNKIKKSKYNEVSLW